MEYEAIHSVMHKLVQTVCVNKIVRHPSWREEKTYQAKSNAHTGKPQPNISTTFMGRSRADELECSEIPKSALPITRERLVSVIQKGKGPYRV